jgi:HAE1 family hydrophobic/amphiphilic exporter-1
VKSIYASPIRVYLLLAFLAAFGIWAGSTLPVSLFPNVTQPKVQIEFRTHGLTPEEFRNKYGAAVEAGLKKIEQNDVRVEKVKAEYNAEWTTFTATFNWNANPNTAQREVNTYIDAVAATMPEDIRKSKSVWGGGSRRNSGFFLATYHSDKRTPSEVYNLVQSLFKASTANLKDAQNVALWNPDNQEIAITLRPERMISLGVFPQDIVAGMRVALQEHSGGSVKIGVANYTVTIPKQARSVEDIESLFIPTPNKGFVRLSEIAQVSLKKSQDQLFKTSGVQSLIIYATPKEDGNIKRLSEELKERLNDIAKTIPPDIKYKVLVDPSLFIRDSVTNVVHEVAIGATLAVVILFLFIGSFKNVITAAIEIPLSLVMAFLLMKAFGMNLNLISLGGLALSSGMNVDASVVVMENIFRKFEGVQQGSLSPAERLSRVVDAVREVWFPILASTIASLVVFIPIIFTSDLTYAILGDLARAVVFSHVFSAFVALLLVPTVRLHIMNASRAQNDTHQSPIEFFIVKMENMYEKALRWLVRRKRSIAGSAAIVAFVLALLAAWVLPRLPREIVGKPDSNIVGMWISGTKFTRIQQVEALTSEVERTLQKDFPNTCDFVYTEIHGAHGGSLLCSLKSKRQMKSTLEALEKKFTSTPEKNYNVFQWNLAELPLPNPPDVQIDFSGATFEERTRILEKISDTLHGKFPKINFYSNVSTSASPQVNLTPRLDVWRNLPQAAFSRSPSDIVQAIRAFSSREQPESLVTEKDSIPISIAAPQFQLADLENLRAFPIAVGEKILPLRALFDVSVKPKLNGVAYEDGEPMMNLVGRIPLAEKPNSQRIVESIKEFVESLKTSLNLPNSVSFELGEPDKEVRTAIQQLGVAAMWSVVLIFITMLLQFGSVLEALLVLVAIPLALIGVLLSLFVFKSTLSVNSVLGVILLNGISVANSILLVDFAKRLFAQGLSPTEAVVTAARRRLRPILITSLTTILGMMPIALGYGEGGKVLQPLGIAVSGGMGISMLLTIFMVPALHRVSLEWQWKKHAAKEVQSA